MRLLAELADLGAQLARHAAAHALAEEAAAPLPSEPVAEPPPKPASEPLTNPALVAATLRAPSLRAPSIKPIGWAVLFTRLVACVRDTVALEARLAGFTATDSRATDLLLRADPRRATLRDGFRHVTKNHPDRIDLLRDSNVRLDEELAADPTQKRDIPDLFFSLCDELGIEIDLARLPDVYLGFEFDPNNPPDPRATSPP